MDKVLDIAVHFNFIKLRTFTITLESGIYQRAMNNKQRAHTYNRLFSLLSKVKGREKRFFIIMSFTSILSLLIHFFLNFVLKIPFKCKRINWATW